MTTYCWKFWKFCLNLNRTRLHKIRGSSARNNYIKVSIYNKNLSFISSKKYDSFSHFFSIAYSYWKANKKLTSESCQKYVKAIKNLASDKRSLHASLKLFTNLLHLDSRKCRLRELFVDLLDFLKQGTTSNWILMTQMLPPVNCAWLCWLYWCSGNYSVKHKRLILSGWTVRQWTCIRTQFCLFKQHWRRNYRTVYPNAQKICLWFFWFSQLLLKTL